MALFLTLYNVENKVNILTGLTGLNVQSNLFVEVNEESKEYAYIKKVTSTQEQNSVKRSDLSICKIS